MAVSNLRTVDCFKKVFTGGAPVFPHVLDKIHAAAPEADIMAVYGSTEAEPISLLNRRDISSTDRDDMASGLGLLAGLPDKAIHVRIVRDNGGKPIGGLTKETFQSACSAPTEPGQVVVAGPHVQPGCSDIHADQETQLRVAGTLWHQTGDAGYFDAWGRLWLLGRCCARIRDVRGTVYPFQVECLAYQDPGVRRAALLAHENRRVLAIESKKGIDAQAMKAKLAWASIDAVKVLTSLPVDKRHNSKIDYTALQSIFRGHRLNERV